MKIITNKNTKEKKYIYKQDIEKFNIFVTPFEIW